MQNIWSVVDLLRRNPHWWSPITSSAYGINLESRMLDKIFYVHFIYYNTNHKTQFTISNITTCFDTGVPSSGKELIMNCVLWFILYCLSLSAFCINTLNQLKCVSDCLPKPMLAKCLAHIIVLDSTSPNLTVKSNNSLYFSRPANVVGVPPSCNPQSTGTNPEFVSLRLWAIRFRLTTARFTTDVQEQFSS